MDWMINLLERFFRETVFLFNEMAIYLLIGFGLAGLIHAFLPRERIERAIGKPGALASIKSALLGVPLPLCSCGVVPTALSLRDSGATKGATVSFLISTPQTGVDSIAATWSMLGPVFAVFRPVVAFVTGALGGFVTDGVEKHENDVVRPVQQPVPIVRPSSSRLMEALRYGFITLLGDIARWVLLGVLIGGAIATALPVDFFERFIGSPVLTYTLVLVASIPIYVCATGSIPVAMALVMKGMSPGAAFVFLMAGPATNAASITVIWKSLGRRATLMYLVAIVGGAVGGGLVFDAFFAGSFTESMAHLHGGDGWFGTVKIAGSVVLAVLLLVVLVPRNRKKDEQETVPSDGDLQFTVSGMTCNGCRGRVLQTVLSVDGVTAADADLETSVVSITGTPDPDQLREALSEAGYPMT